MADIADTTVVHRASRRDAAPARAPASVTPLADVSLDAWRNLAGRAIEPNGYYLPDWELAVNASARGRAGTSALSAFRDTQLIGLLPVIPMWRAYRIPLPVLVSADPYGNLSTPVLDRDHAETAALAMMRQARDAGAHALILRSVTLDGRAMKAFREELRRDGLRPLLLQSHLRAALNAVGDADELLYEALGAKKLKELRRQRNRLAEHGAVHFDVARSPQEVASAVETFLTLEASGWKAKRGTALAQDDGDAGFVRRATVALAANGQCEIISLRAGETPVAAGVVLRQARPRLLLQARRRRALCEVFTGRAVDARSDPASLRRSRHPLRRFHRRPRASHDQSDLARAACDRRRTDPAAAARSGRPR